MKTGRGVVMKATAEILAKAVGLITFPIVTRYVGAEGYGAFGQLTTVVGFIIPFATLGLGGAMVRFFAAEAWTNAVRRRFVRLGMVVTLLTGVISLAMVLLAPLLNRLFLNNWDHGNQLFSWGALLIVVGALEQLLLDFLRSRQSYIYLALMQIAQTFSVLGLTIGVLHAGFGVLGLLWLTLGVKACFVSAIFVGFWLWDKPEQGTSLGKWVPVVQMIRFGLPMAVSGLGLFLMNFGDRLVIGHYLQPDHLGVYTAVYSFSSLLLAVNGPLLFPLYPRLMQGIATGSLNQVSADVRLFHRYMTIVLVPSVTFLLAAMKPLLLRLGGREFDVGFPVVFLLLTPMFMDQWNAISQYMLLCLDEVVYIQNRWLWTGAVNFAANILVVPFFGLSGAAMVTFGTFVWLEYVFYVRAAKKFPLKSLYRFDMLGKTSLASIGGLAAGAYWILLGPGTLPRLVLGAGVFGTVYLALLFALRELGKADLDVLIGILKRQSVV